MCLTVSVGFRAFLLFFLSTLLPLTCNYIWLGPRVPPIRGPPLCVPTPPPQMHSWRYFLGQFLNVDSLFLLFRQGYIYPLTIPSLLPLFFFWLSLLSHFHYSHYSHFTITLLLNSENSILCHFCFLYFLFHYFLAPFGSSVKASTNCNWHFLYFFLYFCSHFPLWFVLLFFCLIFIVY